MNYIPYIIKFIYRIRYWLIIAPLLVALTVYFKTSNRTKNYTAYSTIYTGVITGVNILSESGITTTSSTQSSMMDNLLNIITSDQTLKNVSLRLYARCMVYGNPDADNEYIQANHYRYIYEHGKPIHHLIDKSSPNDSINEVNTFHNLLSYETKDPDNYVYGIYQWYLPYFNRNALKQIQVERQGNSDLLELSYTTDDPGIAYQTLLILNDEFINQYQFLRFGETNNVIAYFETELRRIAKELRQAEDALTDYSIANRVINYGEETKQIAVQNTDFVLNYWTIVQNTMTSEHLIQELEKRMGFSIELYRKNSNFLNSTNKISDISQKLAIAEIENAPQHQKDSLKNLLNETENSFHDFANLYSDTKYSKEGLSNESVITEWLNQIIINEKNKAALNAINDRKNSLDEKYVHFAPIGSTLNRKERSVSIAEKEYFSILGALNAARLRQKSLQMTSATLRVMDEPVFPVSSVSTSRRNIVIMAFLATLIFVLFFFLLVELLDHTLHNKLRVKIITGGHAIAAFTRFSRLSYRQYNTLYTEISAKNLCNFVQTYFKPNQTNIINIISFEPLEGKSFVAEHVAQTYLQEGLTVKKVTGDGSKSLDLALPDQVVLAEYPSFQDAAMTESMLQSASVNLLIVDSRRTWKNTDQLYYERTKEMAANVPLFFVLNYTNRDAAEEFNGLMPPYTFLRKLFYRLSQLGLTAQDKHRKYA